MSLLTVANSMFVSQYNGYEPNNVWSNLKHVRAREHGVVQWSTALEKVRKLRRLCERPEALESS